MCHLEEGIDITIPPDSSSGVKAFDAPSPSFEPLKQGSFTGSLEKGSPVNFYNIFINPHGNGTHTETARHIAPDGPFISDTLHKSHFMARLVTADPRETADGDRVIDKSAIDWKAFDYSNLDALIVRTLPNDLSKKTKDYTGTNPCYLDAELVSFLSEQIDHLVVDLPSVDKESDGGALAAHKAFWRPESDKRYHKTITELVYVDSKVEDGLYLLEIQTLPLKLDVSPSRLVLFGLKEI